MFDLRDFYVLRQQTPAEISSAQTLRTGTVALTIPYPGSSGSEQIVLKGSPWRKFMAGHEGESRKPSNVAIVWM